MHNGVVQVAVNVVAVYEILYYYHLSNFIWFTIKYTQPTAKKCLHNKIPS